ncbi:MAG: PQQ-binding-like beta-propeller repeat protein [Deltaproteobacteria bacterium]|nr:PQQ-binding-like beta-propeller repeat protein [Candidatus Zymogenaceae bacterium]
MRNVYKYKMFHVTAFILLSIVFLLIGCERNSPVSIKWTYDTGLIYNHYFEIVDDVLYASYPSGDLYAIDKNNGTLKWKYHDEEKGFTNCSVADDVVYVGRFCSYGCDRYETNFLYAIDSTDGELMWRFNLGDNEVIYNYDIKPTIADGVVYMASPFYYLYAIDMDSHEPLWRVDIILDEASIRSILSVSDGMVYFYTKEDFYAVDTITGNLELKWETESKKTSLINTATEADGIVYISVNYFKTEKDYLYAIDALSGELKWKYEADLGRLTTPPAVFDGVIYFGSVDDYLYALDIDTGELFWKCKMRGIAMSPPTVVDGIIYVGCNDHKLYALNANNGELLWRFKTGGRVFSSIIVEEDVIYFGSQDGYLYALEINGNNQ